MKKRANNTALFIYYVLHYCTFYSKNRNKYKKNIERHSDMLIKIFAKNGNSHSIS